MTEPEIPEPEELDIDVGSAPPVRPASSRTLGIIGVSIAAVLILLLLITLVPRRSVEHELLAEVARTDSAPVVQVTTVHRAAAGSTLSLPSTIQALHESAVYARVGGYVKSWHADIGRVVRAGETLLEIDAPELEEDVQHARLQVTQTKASLALARADLERWRQLARDSAVTGQELDQKSAAFEVATANTAAAEASLRRLVQTRQYTRVVAPFTGVVTARNVDIGSLISAAGATSSPVVAGGGSAGASPGSLYRIAQTDTVRTYLTVPEAYATSIRPGLAATIVVQGIPGRTFTGIVARTSGSLDVASRTMLTEIDVPNRDFALLPGMFAKAELTFPRATPPLLLPANTLLIRSSGVQVAEVVPERTGNMAVVHFRSVQVARDYGATVEVAGGVIDGMMVVTNPNAELVDGGRVRLQPTAPRATP
ncbi:MAG: efflux RND transporter periplasmic adaptor subunit [Gemmatimonadaceae bacterium]